MGQEIPDKLIEKLLALGRQEKEWIKDEVDIIDFLKDQQQACHDFDSDSWQAICASLSRDNHILLFKGVVYADILAWEPGSLSPVNHVFAKLNTRFWPDTVFSLIRWALTVCDYHKVEIGHYAFAGMLDNR